MTYLKKALIFVLIVFLSAGAVFARGADETPAADPADSGPVPLRLLVPSGATLATVALLEDSAAGAGYDLQVEVVKATDLIAARIISGQTDFAVIPTNLAAVLANKGADVMMAGPSIWGLLYVVTSEDLDGIQDLKGRTVNMIGRGLTPDITFRHLLEQNGLVPDEDVTITYASGATELAPFFLTGKSTISMMPEPMITTVLTKKPDTKILLDVQEEWSELYGGSYPQAGLVVSSAFAEAWPGITDAFIADYSDAVAAAVADPEAAGLAAAGLAEEMNPGIFAAAVPRMNLEFTSAADARESLERYYQVLEAFNPATIGGKLPSDGFYLP